MKQEITSKGQWSVVYIYENDDYQIMKKPHRNNNTYHIVERLWSDNIAEGNRMVKTIIANDRRIHTIMHDEAIIRFNNEVVSKTKPYKEVKSKGSINKTTKCYDWRQLEKVQETLQLASSNKRNLFTRLWNAIIPKKSNIDTNYKLNVI